MSPPLVIPAQARALYFVAPRRTEIRELPLVRGDGELLVRSRLQGISAGTEMLFYRGDFPDGIEGDLPGLPDRLSYPLAYGYSNVGVDENDRRVFAFMPHQDFFCAREEDLIPLPDAITDEDAIFLPNMETALGIVQDLNPVFGESVAIIGLGVIGLLVAELLARTRPNLLILADVKEGRRAAAEKLGAVFVNPASESFSDRARELTEGRGIDRAVNVSASGEALGALIEAMGMEGVLIEASWYGAKRVELALGRAFHRRRLDLRSSQVSRIGASLGARWDKKRRMALALRMLAEIRPGRLISHVFPFRRAPEAYELLAKDDGETLQTALSCGEYSI